MKDDIDRELREMFTRRAADPAEPAEPPLGLVRRVRRRQGLTIIGSLAAVTAIVLASISVVQLVSQRNQPSPADSQVVLPDAPPGFLSAALPYASIAYPDGWYLLETSPLVAGPSQAEDLPPGPILQLSNFDPDVPHAPRCMVEPDQVPVDGVLLSVAIVSPQEAGSLPSDGPWPVTLHEPPRNTEPVCEIGSSEQATWTAPSGVRYMAQTIYGEEAEDADVAAIEQAFGTLLFPPTAAPQLSRMTALQGLGTPRVVLGTTTVGSDVLTFVAYLELGRELLVGVESTGPYGSASAPHSGSDPNPPMSAGLVVVSPEGALLYGTISPVVDRVEVRTDAGDAVPVPIVPLPSSLGLDDRFVWAIVPGGSERSTIVGYDAEGNVIGNPIFPTEPDQVLATGENEGGTWTLSLTHDNSGWGLAFSSGEGGGGGGGGFGDLGDRIFYSAFSSGPSWSAGSGVSPVPQELAGEVTERAARAEFHLVDGSVIEASLYPVPADAFGGGAQVYLLFVPSDVLVKAGEMVAYDADGNEMGRQYLDFSPVPLFPKVLEESSPEAVEAMRNLQVAGAVAGRYYQTHDLTWEGFDSAAASAVSDAVVYNSSDTAITGEVSIRSVSPDALVLATRAANGQVYSVCMQGGSGSMYGRNDTSDPDACSNGWLDPPG